MRKVLKWLGIGLGVLVGLLLLALAGVLGYGEIAYGRTHDRPIYPITADTSPEGIAHGGTGARRDGLRRLSRAGRQREMIGTSEQLTSGRSAPRSSFQPDPDEETGLGHDRRRESRARIVKAEPRRARLAICPHQTFTA